MNVEGFGRFLHERILEFEIDSNGAGSSSTADEQESILKNYFISRKPQTTRNYPLNEYIGPVTIDKSWKMGRGLFVDRPVDSGQILLISNSEAACISNYKLEEINRAVNVNPPAPHPRTTQSDLQNQHNELGEVAIETFGVQARNLDANHVFGDQQNNRTDKAARADTNNTFCSGFTSESDRYDELKLGTDHAKTRIDINGNPVPMFTFSSLPPSGSAPASESSPQNPLPGSDGDRVPPDVMKQLGAGLLLRASSLWKFMQIFSLDHSSSPVSDDHIAMPIHDIHFYRDLPTRKGKRKVETDENDFWMDMLKGPVNRSHDEEAILSIIVAKNASFDRVKSRTRDEPRKVETCEHWGVWLLPSFINHSCAPTCNRLRVGDALIIRAARCLQAGEEITLPYFNIFETLPVREKFARIWGFRCECIRCNFERSLGEPFEGIQGLLTNLKEDLDTLWKDNPNAVTEDILVKMMTQIGYINPALRQKYRFSSSFLPEEVRDKAVSIELAQVTVAARKLCLDQANHHDEKHQTQFNPFAMEEGDHDTVADLGKGMRNRIRCSWIEASFIHAYIAGHALTCKYGDLGVHEFIDAYIARYGLALACKSGDIGVRAFTYLSVIIDLIGNVHPGNTLGQHYGYLFYEALNQLLQLEPAGIKVEQGPQLRSLLVQTERRVLKFAAAYYGPQDPALLRTKLVSDELARD